MSPTILERIIEESEFIRKSKDLENLSDDKYEKTREYLIEYVIPNHLRPFGTLTYSSENHCVLSFAGPLSIDDIFEIRKRVITCKLSLEPSNFYRIMVIIEFPK